jgi:hypothetical protein
MNNVINVDKKIITRIYNDVYLKMNNQYIDVFLCGGADPKKHIRDKVRNKIKKMKNIKILYPEDLFIEILNIDKNSDLLSLEQFLADNCDFICVIVESPGSFVELGAFVNSSNTIDKVIGVVEQKRKKEKSFIMQGPIKLLSKNDKNSVVYYDTNNIDDLSNILRTVFYRRKRLNNKHNINKKSINTIIGLYNFIPLLLYFYNEIEVSEMKNFIKEIFMEYKLDQKNFNTMYNSSLKLLYKDKYFVKTTNNLNTVYSLTEKGYIFINKILQEMNIKNKTKLYDSIRFDIMNEKYYNKPRSS